MEASEYILEMSGIVKNFAGMCALKSVQLKVKRGTIHALMGENGAGKSTLCKVLIGLYQADEGVIYYKGKQISFKNTQEALNSGIAMIHQELANCPERTVAENFFLGREIKSRWGLVHQQQMICKCQEELTRLGIHIDASRPMSELSVAQQQLCEIAKAVSYNADLLIMDEPTSALTEEEVQHLFQIIDNLIQQGITIIYISHKLEEIFQITNEISVFRDGNYVGTIETARATQDELVRMMVGRSIDEYYPSKSVALGEVTFRVENLSCEGIFENINFEVHKGEILGVAGLMGAGRSEVMETIFGVRKKTCGDIYIDDKKVEINNPRDAIRYKVGFVTEDRKYSGLFLPLSVSFNCVLAALDHFSKFSFVSNRRINEAVERICTDLQIKTQSLNKAVNELSGGNQQKVLVGKWLLTAPKIMIFDEPTRGIDVGAKALIYSLLNELQKQGITIIMVSSELPEILGMCDRVMVMHEGKVTGFIDRADATKEKILRYATGIVD